MSVFLFKMAAVAAVVFVGVFIVWVAVKHTATIAAVAVVVFVGVFIGPDFFYMVAAGNAGAIAGGFIGSVIGFVCAIPSLFFGGKKEGEIKAPKGFLWRSNLLIAVFSAVVAFFVIAAVRSDFPFSFLFFPVFIAVFVGVLVFNDVYFLSWLKFTEARLSSKK